jgi:hypothetical protein
MIRSKVLVLLQPLCLNLIEAACGLRAAILPLKSRRYEKDESKRQPPEQAQESR